MRGGGHITIVHRRVDGRVMTIIAAIAIIAIIASASAGVGGGIEGMLIVDE